MAEKSLYETMDAMAEKSLILNKLWELIDNEKPYSAEIDNRFKNCLIDAAVCEWHETIDEKIQYFFHLFLDPDYCFKERYHECLIQVIRAAEFINSDGKYVNLRAIYDDTNENTAGWLDDEEVCKDNVEALLDDNYKLFF